MKVEFIYSKENPKDILHILLEADNPLDIETLRKIDRKIEDNIKMIKSGGGSSGDLNGVNKYHLAIGFEKRSEDELKILQIRMKLYEIDRTIADRPIFDYDSLDQYKEELLIKIIKWQMSLLKQTEKIENKKEQCRHPKGFQIRLCHNEPDEVSYACELCGKWSVN